jgi:hypothetical protein
MTPETLSRLAPPLIVLQFAAFGWRVNREINLPAAERQTYVPIPDCLNILSLFAAVICLIVIPIKTDAYLWLSRVVLGIGYVLIAFHPFTTAAHYRLWSRSGRSTYVTAQKDYPYATGEELVLSSFSVVVAILAAMYIWTH